MTSSHSVLCMKRFSHTLTYSFKGLQVDMSFRFLMVLMDLSKFLYSSSLFACVINFAVVRSSVSSPKALITLMDPFVACGLSLTGVYLCIKSGGVVCFLDGSLLSASANVLSSALMCWTLML